MFNIPNLKFLLYNWNCHVWLMNLFIELGVKFVLTQLENSMKLYMTVLYMTTFPIGIVIGIRAFI